MQSGVCRSFVDVPHLSFQDAPAYLSNLQCSAAFYTCTFTSPA